MLAEVLALVPQRARVIADLTLGLGGHAEAILKQVGGEAVLFAFDRDADSLALAADRLRALPNRIEFFQDSYTTIDAQIDRQYRGMIDFALMDLGQSSYEMEHSGRGFSFTKREEPLDLRFDATAGEPLSRHLMHSSAEELAAVFRKYGEVRRARAVASAVTEARKGGELATVGDLVPVLDRFTRPDQRHKFLAKCWQALRIWHNEELDELQRGLQSLPDWLKPEGVIAVITFHSLEDRMVKEFFLRQESPCICPPRAPVCACGRKATLRRVNKRSQTPTQVEIDSNPRARSARLRAARRLFDS